MKKIMVVASIIVIIAVVCIIFTTTSNISSKEAIEKGTNFCDNLILCLKNGEHTNSDLKNISMFNKNIDTLIDSDNRLINLTEYFKDIIVIEEVEEEYVISSESGLSEEEISELLAKYGNGQNNKRTVEEDKNIFKNEYDEKCIKVNDLNQLTNGDYTIKYYDGEYVINKEDVVPTYKQLKDKNYFDFELISATKVDKNEYEFIYRNSINDYNTTFIFNVIYKNGNIDNFTFVVVDYNPFDI